MNAPEIVGWIIIGLLALVLTAVALVALWLAVNVVWRWLTPDHWVLMPPRFGKARPYSVFANPSTRVIGRTTWRHPETIRRLGGVGPFVIWAIRYKPGLPPEEDQP